MTNTELKAEIFKARSLWKRQNKKYDNENFWRDGVRVWSTNSALWSELNEKQQCMVMEFVEEVENG